MVQPYQFCFSVSVWLGRKVESHPKKDKNRCLSNVEGTKYVNLPLRERVTKCLYRPVDHINVYRLILLQVVVIVLILNTLF